MHQIRFSTGDMTQTPLGRLTALPRPKTLAVFKGPTSRGGEGKEEEGRVGPQLGILDLPVRQMTKLCHYAVCREVTADDKC